MPAASPSPIDLYLQVNTEYDRKDRLVLVYELSSPSGRGSVHRLEAVSEPLGLDRNTFRERLRGDLQKLLQGTYSDSPIWVSGRIDSKLRNLGQNLFLRLLPENLRRLLNEFAISGDLSLLIESDETDIPWEVLHTEGPKGGFLALRFSLSRWLNQPVAPRVDFPVLRILAIEAGNISDPEIPGQRLGKLQQTRDELEILEMLAGANADLSFKPIYDADLPSVRKWLEAGGYDMIHFAGHSDFFDDRADAALLYLNGANLEAQDLVGPMAEALKRARPLVGSSERGGDQPPCFQRFGRKSTSSYWLHLRSQPQ